MRSSVEGSNARGSVLQTTSRLLNDIGARGRSQGQGCIVRSGNGTIPLDEDVRCIIAGKCELGADSVVAVAPGMGTLAYLRVTM